MSRQETTIPDVYDREIAYLAEHPKRLFAHWYVSSPLFSYCTPSRAWQEASNGEDCGCPTMIRSVCANAWTEQLTSAIQADDLIPDHFREFARRVEQMPLAERIAALQPFAYWQRRLDRELDRTVPETFPGETVTTN